MDGLLFAALILALAGHSSATWCVCKDGVGDATLQKTLDYACGAGADCNPIHQNAACYNPNTLKAHCNYAVNSFFQKKGQSQGSCDFAGTASVTTSDPSSTGCVYPASASSTSTSTSPVSTTPSSTTPTTTTPTTTTPSTTVTPSTTTPVGGSPYVTTPTGVLGPTGTGINTDVSEGGLMLHPTSVFSSLIILMFSAFMF
ncbi:PLASMODESMATA CALLOSE-BINDING PROTEIN 3-like [Camellia sinensis]|uniref:PLASMODESMATA CALLOSE-BINDING PROTEIN 3-like n=1 Tax=Camellia sinensis TaxID=4442 RepID=UPI001036E9BD|nr:PLASMODESMATA CALLOSE-BINDING PROTEIN 3-like [Camellia sinensis]